MKSSLAIFLSLSFAAHGVDATEIELEAINRPGALEISLRGAHQNGISIIRTRRGLEIQPAKENRITYQKPKPSNGSGARKRIYFDGTRAMIDYNCICDHISKWSIGNRYTILVIDHRALRRRQLYQRFPNREDMKPFSRLAPFSTFSNMEEAALPDIGTAPQENSTYSQRASADVKPAVSNPHLPSSGDTLDVASISREPEPEPFDSNLPHAIAELGARGVLELDPNWIDQPSRSRRSDAKPNKIRHQLEAKGSENSIPAIELKAGELGDIPLPAHCLDDLPANFREDGIAPMSSLISTARQSLLSEVQALDAQAAIDLAWLYASYGFAPEAINAIDILTDNSVPAETVKQIAGIIGSEGGLDRSFSFAIACTEIKGVWSLLGTTGPIAGKSLNSRRIKESYYSLPTPLQELLGQRLARRLRETGSNDLADFFTGLSPSMKNSPASAAMKHSETSSDDRQEPLREGKEISSAITSNNELAPDAVIEEIGQLISTQSSVPEKLVDLAEAFAFERSGSLKGQVLQSLSSLGQLANGNFSEAMHGLELNWLQWDLDVRVETAKRLAKIALGLESDIEFAAAVGLISDQLALELDSETSNMISSRLQDVGMHEMSSRFLSLPTSGAERDEQQLLRARLALSQNRVQGAFSELNDNDSIEADRLRAEALALDGKHRAASELFDQIGYRQRAARENWLAEDWQALSAGYGETSQGRAAGIRLATQNSVNSSSVDPETRRDVQSIDSAIPAEPSLQAANDALELSNRTRETIVNLLNQP